METDALKDIMMVKESGKFVINDLEALPKPKEVARKRARKDFEN